MFESIKRFGKLLKYGIQGIIAIAFLSCLFFEIDSEVGGIFFLVAIALIAFAEVTARGIAWVVSGYFETNPGSKIDPIAMQRMKDYYRYQDVKRKLSKILNK